mmetsp:Transcript_22556/g.51650  ORF Transcript_22556/g.51650 Transcript_22556/m.51650 type:complete len:209 (+) Transcript_22556:174-800(+)
MALIHHQKAYVGRGTQCLSMSSGHLIAQYQHLRHSLGRSKYLYFFLRAGRYDYPPGLPRPSQPFVELGTPVSDQGRRADNYEPPPAFVAEELMDNRHGQCRLSQTHLICQDRSPVTGEGGQEERMTGSLVRFQGRVKGGGRGHRTSRGWSDLINRRSTHFFWTGRILRWCSGGRGGQGGEGFSQNGSAGNDGPHEFLCRTPIFLKSPL